MSLTRLAALGVVTCSLVSCASGPVDELAGEDGDGDEKADGTAPSYFQIAPDRSDALGGFRVSRPNKATTRCGADTKAPSCFIRAVDLSAAQLAAPVSVFDGLLAGEPIILRGTLAAQGAQRRAERVLSVANGRLIGDLASTLAPAQPMISVGAENGPDCLFAELDVTAMTMTTATLSVADMADGVVAYRGTLDNVSITATARFAVSCVAGSAPIAIQLDHLEVSGQLLIGSDGLLSNALQTVTPSSITVQGSVPSVVDDMLALRDTGAVRVVTATARLVLDSVATAAARPELELAGTEVWLPGFEDLDEDADVENVFVLAKNAGDHIREERLNSVRAASIDQIDFDVANASEESLAAARAALDGTGVILAGTRFLRDDQAGRTAERFWIRAASE